jgi:polyhydroxybutyrate depolymerase
VANVNMRASHLLSLVALALAAACSKSQGSESQGLSDAGPGLGDYDPVPFGGSRPVNLYVPSGYTGAPTPLVVLLHGYSVDGAVQDIYLGLRTVAEEKTVLYAHPDGTVDSTGNRFWNATDACCDFDHSGVDDSGYLAGLVAEIGTRYAVDPKRVYFMGHSNGGFMSYRMACDHADIVSAIVSIAGATWLDTSKCTPSAPVSVLEVHGTADTMVLYGGGGGTAAPDAGTDGGSGGGAAYPGALTTVADWATYDGCSSPPDTSQPPLDLDASIPGAETQVTRYAAGCRAGSEVDLWTIQNGTHIPGFNPTFAPMAFDFLLSHGR